MRTACSLAVFTLALGFGIGRADAATPKAGLGKVVATKLMARKAPPAAATPGAATGTVFRPETHTTDFGTEAIGCITLARWELRDFGYAGHAFLCEEGATGEVVGAVLNKAGVTRCYISGVYIGDGCYDFDICDIPETACVE
jgi:hypothetical protein